MYAIPNAIIIACSAFRPTEFRLKEAIVFLPALSQVGWYGRASIPRLLSVYYRS